MSAPKHPKSHADIYGPKGEPPAPGGNSEAHIKAMASFREDFLGGMSDGAATATFEKLCDYADNVERSGATALRDKASRCDAAEEEAREARRSIPPEHHMKKLRKELYGDTATESGAEAWDAARRIAKLRAKVSTLESERDQFLDRSERDRESEQKAWRQYEAVRAQLATVTRERDEARGTAVSMASHGKMTLSNAWGISLENADEIRLQVLRSMREADDAQ